MSMTSEQRLLTAINGGIPDRLPVTTHHVMPYFLDKYMHGISNAEFFDYFGFDAIVWDSPYVASGGQYWKDGLVSTDGTKIFQTDDWQISCEAVHGPAYPTQWKPSRTNTLHGYPTT